MERSQCNDKVSAAGLTLQDKNIGWESGKQKRASHPIPELKESLQLKWHGMEGMWPADSKVEGFESFSKVQPVSCAFHD